MEEVSLEGTRQGSSAARAWALSQGSVLPFKLPGGRPWDPHISHPLRDPITVTHTKLFSSSPLPQKSLHLQERKFLRLLLILLRLLNSYTHFNTQFKCYPVQ